MVAMKLRQDSTRFVKTSLYSRLTFLLFWKSCVPAYKNDILDLSLTYHAHRLLSQNVIQLTDSTTRNAVSRTVEIEGGEENAISQ
jgi:hypothetical protein